MKRVAIDKLEPGMVLAQDVFVAEESSSAVMMKGAELGQRAIGRLAGWKLEFVFVEGEEEAPAFVPPPAEDARHIAALVEEARHPVETPPPTVSEELRDEALDTLQNLFDSAAPGEQIHPSAQMVENLTNVVDQLVESVLSVRGALVNINDLKSYDDYTYHHSLSVAVLSIGMGQRLGLDGGQLNQLGLCAMMHDIGKTAIPVELIRKPARLSDDEFRLIKTHPAAGHRYLNGSSIGDEPLWRGVLHHHEKWNGKGYPHGLQGEDIPLFSRVIAVADVYDALTSDRPYRVPMQPYEGLDFVMGGVGTDFDYDVVEAFVQQVDLYPPGSVIELSDGRYALVQDNQNPQRPVVELLGSGDVVDLNSDRAYLNVVVKRLVPAKLLGSA